MSEFTEASLSAVVQAMAERIDRLEARLAAVETRLGQGATGGARQSERLVRLEALMARVADRLNLDDNRQ